MNRTFIENYKHAYINGLGDRLRADEISRRITRKIPIPDQIAIAMDILDKPEQHAEYQTFRQSIKDDVDADIAIAMEEMRNSPEYNKFLQ